MIHALNLETSFVTTYSFAAVALKTGNSFTHGPLPNHLSGFGTPTLRVFYDQLAGQNIDMDDSRIGPRPFISPLIPEPAGIALLGLGSLLMLRRRG